MDEDNSGSEVQLRGPVVANKKVARGMWNAWQRTEKCNILVGEPEGKISVG
jgi:hypothetical protein